MDQRLASGSGLRCKNGRPPFQVCSLANSKKKQQNGGDEIHERRTDASTEPVIRLRKGTRPFVFLGPCPPFP